MPGNNQTYANQGVRLAALFFISILCTHLSKAQQKTTIPAKPKLVIGLVIDQMRADYLQRYSAGFGPSGFRRMMRDGFTCGNAMINYLPSFTAPGHACVYTGAVPALHGIAGNEWLDNRTGRAWYCTEDTTVTGIGGSSASGMMSPRNLKASTVSDELKLATGMRSRVFGIAIKDRGAILPAGHLADGAFWYDDSTGNFITSTFYTGGIPQWLHDFNAQQMPAKYLGKAWTLRDVRSSYTASGADTNMNYEGLFKGESVPAFPHDIPSLSRKNFGMLRRIPAGNTYTLDAAKACIKGEKLGRGKATDFLCVSLSSTDYVGHQYGPDALEVEDMYRRLDDDLSEFLNYLDTYVGKGNYLIFLTADHGAAHNAAYLTDIRMPGGNASQRQWEQNLRAYLKPYFKDSVFVTMDNYQVFLNEALFKENDDYRDDVKDKILQWLRAKEEVAYAIDMEKGGDVARVPQQLREMILNGYDRHRSGVIQIILDAGWYSGYANTGTTHGSWNPYDTHIPLLWYGWHVPQGRTQRLIHMTDIAATLAAILGVQFPSACIGLPITEIVK